jgi:phosphoribosylanthranilate isomerase
LEKTGNEETGKMDEKMETCRIKICGLRRDEDICYVNEVMPEYIGFVFFEKSKRKVTLEQAAYLKDKLNPAICPVGVFVREDKEQVLRLLDRDIIQIAQLHGDEPPEYYEWLRDRTDKPLIQALQFKAAEIQRLLQLARDCRPDYYLFDSGMGSGRVFDWTLLQSFLSQLSGELEKPFFLAGGLTDKNVAEAVSRLHPFAVDVSSSVETDGCKDIQKIRSFTSAVRSNRNYLSD